MKAGPLRALLDRAAVAPRSLEGPAPAATRRIRFETATVDYRLLRTRRRSIGMEIDAAGLTVRAPRWAAIGQIEDALRERATWIIGHLETWSRRRRDVLPARWRSGDTLVYRGSDLTLVLYPSRETALRADLFHLTVTAPDVGDPVLVSELVTGWMRAEMLRLLAPHVAACAHRVGKPAPEIRISNARREWGHCSQQGRLALNWRLVQLPPGLADYVVAHEVAHLVEFNHSPRFWAIVEELHPGCRQARKALAEWAMLLA